MRSKTLFILSLLFLSACNLGKTPPAPMVGTDGAVVISDPLNGAALPAGIPLKVIFSSEQGPFIEASLSVDGTVVTSVPISDPATSYSGNLIWEQPTAGDHQLTVLLVTADKEMIQGGVQISVTVSDPASASIPTYEIPVNAPVLPTVPPEIKARIILAYQENFGLNLTSPIIGRKERSGVTTDPWVSTAYIGDHYYQVDLFPDGRVEAFSRSIPGDHGIPPGIAGNEKSLTACRPAGRYKLLFVFLDYGNLGVNEEQVLTALGDATSDINDLFARMSSAAGESSPILQMETVGAYVPYNVEPPDNELTAQQFGSLSGQDITQFDMLVQVELDSTSRARTYWEAQSGSLHSFAYANGQCGSTPTTNHIWLSIDAERQLHGTEGRIFDTVLAHEVFHLFGYPGTHDWMCGDGTYVDASDQCSAVNFPSVMLGWADSDGDGVVEILDPTPYGLQP